MPNWLHNLIVYAVLAVMALVCVAVTSAVAWFFGLAWALLAALVLCVVAGMLLGGHWAINAVLRTLWAALILGAPIGAGLKWWLG